MVGRKEGSGCGITTCTRIVAGALPQHLPREERGNDPWQYWRKVE